MEDSVRLRACSTRLTTWSPVPDRAAANARRRLRASHYDVTAVVCDEELN